MQGSPAQKIKPCFVLARMDGLFPPWHGVKEYGLNSWSDDCPWRSIPWNEGSRSEEDYPQGRQTECDMCSQAEVDMPGRTTVPVVPRQDELAAQPAPINTSRGQQPHVQRC